MTQIPSPAAPWQVGDRVLVRRERWQITAFDPHDDCVTVTLSGADAHNAGIERRVLAPFERIDRLRVDHALCRVTKRRWRRACGDVLAAAGTTGSLWWAARADIDLLAHQLEPALAVVRGLGTRVLIADAVGLGKTIQTAIIVGELLGRGAASRVLILTPAGLREQWQDELSTRFGMAFTIVDARQLRQARRLLPIGSSPWLATPLAVSSLDFAKRPDVMADIERCAWDVVVVDEAHGAVNDSDRHRSVARLGGGAPYVILLTATPHDGSPQAFASLLALGERGDRPLVFRRTRTEVGGALERRVHQLQVRPGPDERRLHQRLRHFATVVEREHGREQVALALAVLEKRALSSAHALRLSAQRRLDALGPEPVAAWQQPLLPLDDGETCAADAMPAWTIPALADHQQERQLLLEIVGAAERAARREAKLQALARLLRRIRQPAIVFTEYRDTLSHVRRQVAPDAAIIHGGLTRRERATALAKFAAGAAVLLATDAAGEGLNLHATCRVVINLELPWTPARLEQRIGRVDRIGQRRRIHVFHLIARDTLETRILKRLQDRVAIARATVGMPDPLHARRGQPPDTGAALTPTLRLEAAAATELRRLQCARRLAPAGIGTADLVATGSAALRRSLGGRDLLIAATGLRAGHLSVPGSHVAAALLPPRGGGLDLSRCHALAEQLLPEEREAWLEAAREWHAAFWGALLSRETAIAGRPVPAEHQPGLFDRRAERSAERNALEVEEMARLRATRLARIRQRAGARLDTTTRLLGLTFHPP